MAIPEHEIKDRLRDALDMRKMTQQDLADKSNIPKASISQYLSGYAKPKQDRISSMADALNVDPVWLMGYDTSEPTPDTPELAPHEEELLGSYRQLNDVGQGMTRAYAKGLTESDEYRKEKTEMEDGRQRDYSA